MKDHWEVISVEECVQKPKADKRTLEGMTEKQFDIWVLSRMDVCQCLDCSTHNECAKKTGERLYCVAARSPVCIETKKGCLCGECPVYEELGLGKTYHCLNGPEIARSI